MTVAIDIAQEAIARGVQRAENWLSQQIQNLPAVQNLRQLTEEMHVNELALEELRERLVRLKDLGIARRTDYEAYETSRANMYAMHSRYHRLLRRIFESYPEILGQLPGPKMAPKVLPGPPNPAPGATAGLLGSGGGQSLRDAGLGDPVTATAAGGAAAATIPGWMMAAIVLIILASIVAVIAIVITGALTEEVIRDVVVTREQLGTTRQMYEIREQVYNDCRAQGGSPAACAGTAEGLAPTPPEVLRELPRPGEWTKWVAIGLGVLVVGGLAFWGIHKLSDGRRARRPRLEAARPRYRSMSPDEWLDGGDAFDYGMEDV